MRHCKERDLVNGLMYVLSTGCQWRAIPKDLSPRSTLHDYLDVWSYDGTLDRIHHTLYVKCREAAEREASPTAAIIDSQSVKSGRKRGASINPRGYDAGKKACPCEGGDPGKKRHILVDTQGLLMHALVHSAGMQDRDGGILVMATLFGQFAFLEKLFADGGYQGPEFQAGMKRILPNVEVEIVKRSDKAKGFIVLIKRWLVERTIGWLNRCRRLAKDWECLNRNALNFLRLASIRLMLRKLCNPKG